MYVYMLACPFTHLVSIYPDGMSALLVGAVPCIYWPVLTGIDEILTANWKWALETTKKKAGHSSGTSAGILEGRSWIFSLAGYWVGRGWLNTHTIFTKLDSAETIFKLWRSFLSVSILHGLIDRFIYKKNEIFDTTCHLFITRIERYYGRFFFKYISFNLKISSKLAL